MSILIELWRFLKSRKKYWLIPVLVMMFVIGGLLIFAQSSVIAPFIYSLF
jgi:nitrate/TMAO reductase-like tetraheme cytochrome c subunit